MAAANPTQCPALTPLQFRTKLLVACADGSQQLKLDTQNLTCLKTETATSMWRLSCGCAARELEPGAADCLWRHTNMQTELKLLAQPPHLQCARDRKCIHLPNPAQPGLRCWCRFNVRCQALPVRHHFPPVCGAQQHRRRTGVGNVGQRAKILWEHGAHHILDTCTVHSCTFTT